MNRRALTLLEVLIALTLLVALGAIAFPSMMRSLGVRTFEATGDVIVNHLLLARASAQEQGEPVEVVYMTERGRIVARLFEPASLDPVTAGRRAPEAEGFGAPPTWDDAREADEDGPAPIAEGWAVRTLPDGLRLAERPPASMGDDPEAAFAALDDAGMAPGDDVPAVIRIAVYLPDGSAMIAGDFWLSDEEGRSARLHVSPWTGLPVLDPAVMASDEDEFPEDDLDEDDDAAAEEGFDDVSEPDRRAREPAGAEMDDPPAGAEGDEPDGDEEDAP